MMLTTLDTAQRIEEADIIHLTRQVEVCAELFPDEGIQTLAFGGGVAAVTKTEFGRKLNHVSLHASRELPVEVDLCPYADGTAPQALAAAGYTVNGFTNIYVKALADSDLRYPAPSSEITVSRVSPSQTDSFIQSSMSGFASTGRPSLLVETLTRIAVRWADTRLYFASIEGQDAAAGIAVIETSKGRVAHLYIDSAMPEYRGRGVQGALLRKRLEDARREGFEIAVVHARPGTVSARNVEKAGFGLAYTKTAFSKAVSVEM